MKKKKKKNSQPQTKFAGSYKKKSVRERLILSCNFNNLKICYNTLELYQWFLTWKAYLISIN